ncbi:MAG: methyltransferase domain-containing protein [Chloroflexi bacterium]|nr:methyltransferase domain-containing protein [Chloroflexota bacterium]
MTHDLDHDATYFLELQTKTGWGRTLAKFAEWCAIPPGSLALDVGSGPGLLAKLLTETGVHAWGVDVDAEMLAQRLHPAMLQADTYRLPCAPGAVDYALASNMLYLMDEPQPALNEMARAAQRVALLNPSELMTMQAATELADGAGLEGLARDTLLNYAGRAERLARWSADDLSRMFAAAGLDLERTELTMGPGLARMALGVKRIADSRWREADGRQPATPA